MTKDQFNRAVAINKRVNELKEVKKEIGSRSSCRLSFTYKNCDGEYTPCNEFRMLEINEILDRHDAAIRKEIDDEMTKLQQEIESI